MPHIELKTTEGRTLLLIHAHDFREAVEIAINRGICLDGLNASGQNLGNANLDCWHIKNADFTNTNLRGANLSECHLAQCSFKNADMQHACLCYSDLIACNLEQANLTNADLSEATLDQCRLSADTLEPVKIRTLHRFSGNRISSAQKELTLGMRHYCHPEVEYNKTNNTGISFKNI